MWYPNGFIVQELKANKFNQVLKGYNGLGRYTSWPLEHEFDAEAESISDFINYIWFFSYRIAVISEYGYCKEYVLECKKRKMNTRVLFIESSCDNPICDIMPKEKTFLGYDLIFSHEPYSELYDDIILDDIQELGFYKQYLNENGLISDEEIFKSYMAERERLYSEGVDIEMGPNMFPAKLYDASDLFS